MTKVFEVVAHEGVIVLPKDVPSHSRCLVVVADDGFDPSHQENGNSAVDSKDIVNPWAAGAGMLQDDPLFDTWQQAIADYRGESDAIPDAP